MEKRSLSLLLWQAENELEKELNAQIRGVGLTASQLYVLEYLYRTERDEVHQIDVERYLGLKNPTVTGLLKRLEEKGFILTVADGTDRRRKNIFLTEKAHNIRKKTEAQRRKAERRTFHRLSAKERQAFIRQLGKVAGSPEE